MDHSNSGNLPATSRSATDIEKYAKAARQRERQEAAEQRERERAAKEEARARERAATDERRRKSAEERAKQRATSEARQAANEAERAAKEAAAAAKAQEQEDRASRMTAVSASFVETEGMRYVANLDRYTITVNHEPIWFKSEALKKKYPEFQERGFEKAFYESMAYEGRNFLNCTYSAADVGKNTLNLLDRDEWVCPIEGEPHWLFATLMQSLGGNKPENIEHLEHMIWYHYEHPENYMIPAIVLHGEGGTGKNLLVDRILYTMFPRQTVSATAENVIGNFNGLLVGMMVGLINENMGDRGDMSVLKDLLHKPRLTVNIKNVPQFQADNIAMYLIGVNFDGNGGVQLDQSDADRRFSVMFCERGKTLIYWIAKRQGWSLERASEWMRTEGDTICVDRAEVGKWLNDLKQRYQDRPSPKALHGEDFQRLKADQKRTDDRLFEAVFRDPAFNHIERRILYKGYRAICREDAQRYAYGKPHLYRRVDQWLHHNMPDIKLHSTPVRRGGKNVTIYQWAHKDTPLEQLALDNADAYVAGDSDFHCTWQGPELM